MESVTKKRALRPLMLLSALRPPMLLGALRLACDSLFSDNGEPVTADLF